MSKHRPQPQPGAWPEPTKFDTLRLKTEEQLVHLIKHELHLGIRDAGQALKSVDTWTVATEYHRRANRAYATVTRLIPLVVEITENERNEVDSRLGHLQRMLVALSTIGSSPTPAEDAISALARAVWEARGCPQGFPEEDWFRAERALKPKRESHAVCLVS